MHSINNDLIIRIIQTIKEIDARGFDSMARIVELVRFFEDLLNSQDVDNTTEHPEEKG